jgi:hypothetical protein
MLGNGTWMNEMGEECRTHERDEKRLQKLVEKPKGQRQLLRLRRRCEGDMTRKTDPKEMGCDIAGLSIGSTGRLL